MQILQQRKMHIDLLCDNEANNKNEHKISSFLRIELHAYHYRKNESSS